MLGELIIRFVLGGLIVSIFAIIGEVFKPKTFAGIFGAAPSVALASLGLTFLTKSMQHASLDGRSMLCGGIALACWSSACSCAGSGTPSSLPCRHGWHG